MKVTLCMKLQRILTLLGNSSFHGWKATLMHAEVMPTARKLHLTYKQHAKSMQATPTLLGYGKQNSIMFPYHVRFLRMGV